MTCPGCPTLPSYDYDLFPFSSVTKSAACETCSGIKFSPQEEELWSDMLHNFTGLLSFSGIDPVGFQHCGLLKFMTDYSSKTKV